jgi:hypothetical protein
MQNRNKTNIFLSLIFSFLIIVIGLMIFMWKSRNKFGTCPKCACPSNIPLEKKVIKKTVMETIKAGDAKIIKEKHKVYSDILKRTFNVFNKLGIKGFLSSGTCLGYFREGKFIDYDYDIDVGIMEADYNPSIVKEMANQNLHLYRILGNVRDGLELSFRMLNTTLGRHAKIDIFLHYNEVHDGKNMISWYTYASPTFTKKIKYRVSHFDLEKVNFSGTKVYVPSPTLRYVEEHYGKDWMVPKKPFSEYIYHSSPTSIVTD